MKLIRNIIMAVVFASVLIFAGCTDSSDQRTSGYSLDSFKGGSQGLVFSFDEGMPPNTIKDQGITPFNIRIIAENKGEYDIPENSAHARITGINPADFNLQETAKTFPPIFGFSKQGTSERPGGVQNVMFSNVQYVGTLLSGSYNFDLNVNVCYPYQTRAVVEMCISESTISGLNPDFQNCEIEGNKRFANSGAPVRIENVRQFVGGQNRIQIQFDIVHNPRRSSGTLYKPGSIDNQCNINGQSPSDAFFERNHVKYTVNTGIPGLVCGNSQDNSETVVLSNDRTTVVCFQDTAGQGEAHNKLASIILEYDYLDRISKRMTVEHIRTN